jgi:hypothetical protein
VENNVEHELIFSGKKCSLFALGLLRIVGSGMSSNLEFFAEIAATRIQEKRSFFKLPLPYAGSSTVSEPFLWVGRLIHWRECLFFGKTPTFRDSVA